MRACRRQLEHGGRSSQRGSKHAKRDSGTTVVKSAAIVLPEVSRYLKFSAGGVPKTIRYPSDSGGAAREELDTRSKELQRVHIQ